jgi:two-component system chemotaxis response regulator CheY
MGPKVLVADDSGVMRKIIIRSLNACGVTDVVEAGDGVEAFAKFNEQPIDLVLSDWNMPGKSGLEFLKCVRAVNATMPFLLITTEAEKTRVMEAIQAGVSDYVVKPFENDVLKEKLGKFVDAVAVS